MAKITIQYEPGDIVILPFGERGELVKFYDLPWASRWDVKILTSTGFNEVGEICDFFEKDFELEDKSLYL